MTYAKLAIIIARLPMSNEKLDMVESLVVMFSNDPDFYGAEFIVACGC